VKKELKTKQHTAAALMILISAKQMGVSDHVKALLLSQDMLQKYRQQVTKEAGEASRRGVHGVPSFAFDDGKGAFSGAQNVETFVEFLKQHANTVTTTAA
jgi:predicted DsbA family dithiol-disulfide isomerase